MGKASSNKKVARAAGTGGGRTGRGRIAWTYYGVIALVVVLGIAGTAMSRNRYHNQVNRRGGVPPTVGTVWNEGLGIYECGKFVANIKLSRDPNGITTQADGIIHIHPTTKSAAGKNATLGKFASSVGMKLNAGEVQVPGGKLYRDGDKCGSQVGHVYVKQFAFIGDTTGQLQNGDPRNVALQNQALVTIAFVPSGDKAKIPPPPPDVVANLQKLAPAPKPTSPSGPVAPAPGTPPASTPPASTPPASTAPAPPPSAPPPSHP